MHESFGLVTRIQGGTPNDPNPAVPSGPGKGLGQMEPLTFAHIWCSTSKTGRRTKERVKRLRDYLTPHPQWPDWDEEWFDCLDEEACRILEDGDNEWPEGGKACEFLLSDIPMACLMRIYWGMRSDPIPEVEGVFPDLTDDDKMLIACEWFGAWKKYEHPRSGETKEEAEARVKQAFISGLCTRLAQF